jgi:hypothetical protein
MLQEPPPLDRLELEEGEVTPLDEAKVLPTVNA